MVYQLGFQEECITKIEELKAELRDVKDLLRRVLEGLSTNSIPTDHTYPTLPLRSKEELQQTETKLQDQHQFGLLVRTKSAMLLKVKL